MLPQLLYFVSIALFAFVFLAATQIPESTWLVVAIFPVFIASILGFVMWVYAWSEYDVTVSAGAPIVAVIAVLLIRKKSLSARGMFITICAVLVVGLICARFAFIAADLG
jgi:drug/metabolite transporter (DMT)-like permease